MEKKEWYCLPTSSDRYYLVKHMLSIFDIQTKKEIFGRNTKGDEYVVIRVKATKDEMDRFIEHLKLQLEVKDVKRDSTNKMNWVW